MDEYALMKKKLDTDLIKKLEDNPLESLSVIIQTEDGLKDADKTLMKTLGGKIKDDLYIIKAFSADISAGSLKKLILSPRVVKVYDDGKVQSV